MWDASRGSTGGAGVSDAARPEHRGFRLYSFLADLLASPYRRR
ncbi:MULTISPECIES: hypothetical protein [unclassified Synechococcus]|nr:MULTISPECIES: hypothetical protein [unclassified Synechococcus]